MRTLQGKWALVTGASSGMGVEFAKLLAERRANLVLVARRAEPMNRLAEELARKHAVRTVVIGMDLSRPGAAAELKSDLDARGIAIESLVNNAGYGMYGSFLDQKLEAITGMMQVNMLALFRAMPPTRQARLTFCSSAKRCIRSWRPTGSR